MRDEEELIELERLRSLSTLFDSRFMGPFGVRYGLDGILGLIPGVGDFITTGFSVYVLLKASLMGCPTPVLLRMTVNVMTENIVDMIPFIGNLFDFYWKANNKNIELLERYLDEPGRVKASSLVVLLVLFMALVLSLLAGAYVSYRVLVALIDWISGI